MNEDGDIFVFPSKNTNQIELDLDDETSIDLSDMDDTITITSGNSPLLTTMHHGLSVPSSSIGTSGQLLTTSIGGLTTSTGGSLNWATAAPTLTSGGYHVGSQSNYTYDTITLNGSNVKDSALTVKGDALFEGNVKIKGIDLNDRFDEIEKRLAILRPNNDLEGRWEELKELGERYRQLEQEILEKEQVWDILRK
jgi:hypothetical protein